jgi:hypothetical protein
VLAGQRQHPLDDHVVERHGLDQRLEVLGFARQPVHPRAQHLVEQLAELGVQVRGGLLQPRLQRVGLQHADLGVEAIEERHVARLVGDLRAEEQPHLLVRRRAHHRPELGGDALLADEERRQPVHALEALLLVDPLVPVDPVLREVEVLRRPLLALPQLVQLPVAEQVRLAAVRRGKQGRVAGGLEVRPLRTLAHVRESTPRLADQPV